MHLKQILSCWYFAVIIIIIECYQVNRNSTGHEDGSKLIRIVGDVIFGGIFPMHEQVNTNNIK